MTYAQRLEAASRRAVTSARFEVLRRASEAGEDRADAARRAGLTVRGMNSLLYRRQGTTDWPLAAGPTR